ncbi:hypothetical protein MNJPNG_06435 [Cupriavidus oxalaticus]|uniref:hypothetical protein n=1 Tax=Cupriavidus oxalaticus TaxID=96344 RepID=UPI003F738E64
MKVSMFSWRLWFVVAALMAIAAVVAAGFTRSHLLAEVERDAAQREAAEERIARRVQSLIGDDFNQVAERLAQENKDAEKSRNALLADIRAGVRRLYVPIRLPDTGSAAVAGGDQREARAELTGEAAAVLVGITDDGDAGIRALNGCVAAYNKVRARLQEMGAQ